jgi:hypothetical protein
MSNNNLKGFNSVFDSTLNNELQDNIIEFLDWNLLGKGNYFNVTKGETSHSNQDYSLLKLSSYPHYNAGQAWDGFRQNWVWQSGVNPPSGMTAPIVGENHMYPGISGVYVDDTFYSSDTTGDYAHTVDYFNGRVVFDSPIPTGSKVQVEHSYKYINVIYGNNVPWLREIQYRTLDVPSNFNNGKGEFEIPSEMRIQLPAIGIEVVPRRSYKGYQLGGGQYIYTDVLFHCIAEDAYTRNQLLDMVSFQNDKTITLFNNNNIANSGAFPVDYRGVPVSGALRYPDLIDSYQSNHMRFTNFTVQGMEIINSNFSAGIARCTVEVIKSNI